MLNNKNACQVANRMSGSALPTRPRVRHIGVVHTFWSNALRWRLLRAALLGLVAFVALVLLLDPWLAAILAVVAAALALADATRAARASA